MQSNEIELAIAGFLNVFTAWFSVDLIDINDSSQVESAIDACVFDTLQRVADVRAIVIYLEEVLANWDGDRIAPFITSTDVDWLWDEKAEQTLKAIITSIALRLREGMAFGHLKLRG